MRGKFGDCREGAPRKINNRHMVEKSTFHRSTRFTPLDFIGKEKDRDIGFELGLSS